MRPTGRCPAREAGFTLVELLTVMLLTSILLTTGAFAVRHYWFVRSLQGGQDTVVAALREVQQRAMSESHPNVYGIRFLPGTSSFGVVRYNAITATCTAVSNQALGNGTRFTAATQFPEVVGPSGECRNQAPASPDYEIVFFYARGSTSADDGADSIELLQPQTGGTKAVTVSRLTGRVTRS